MGASITRWVLGAAVWLTWFAMGAVKGAIVRFVGFFFSSRRRHTRLVSDWSSDVCSSDLVRFSLKSARELIRNAGFQIVEERYSGYRLQWGRSLPRWLLDRFPRILASGFVFEIGRASCRERV